MTGPRRAGHLPPVAPAAWHGALGEVVARIAPTTEADPIAILATLLGLFGILAGDGPYVRLGGVRHPARVWPLIIGKTGSGRKGTSFAEARSVARQLGPYAETYVRARISSGLSTGEGLLGSLGAGVTDTTPESKEPVAADGRLTVLESEFARVLAAAKREGNTLGPILRQMWDDGSAAILTRAAPLKVDGAHLGLVAHVTPRELRIRLAESDLAGGTMNRFLCIVSERPHLLPYEPPHPDLRDLTEPLADALDRARQHWGEVRRDRSAERLWPAVYEALSADEPEGQLGSVMARGPAYTMRLALTFALADASTTITKDHLLAGLAVWQYSAASARLVFTDARTITDLERLAQFIASAGDGRTRTDCYRFFNKNRTGEQMETLLEELERQRLVTVTADDPAGGRPAQRYHWTGQALDRVGQLLFANE